MPHDFTAPSARLASRLHAFTTNPHECWLRVSFNQSPERCMQKPSIGRWASFLPLDRMMPHKVKMKGCPLGGASVQQGKEVREEQVAGSFYRCRHPFD